MTRKKRVALSGGILLTNSRSPTLAQPPCWSLYFPVCTMGMGQLLLGRAGGSRALSAEDMVCLRHRT